MLRAERIVRTRQERTLVVDRRCHYGLIGAGGFGREVMPILLQQLTRTGYVGTVNFVAENAPDRDSAANGTPIIDLQRFLSFDGERVFAIAIGDSRERERIARICLTAGAEPMSIVDSTARELDENLIGPGAIRCHGSIVTSNTRIGAFFHLNLMSYVAHDCIIGDYVTFAPGVQCNGNVEIGDRAYIGTGAVIKNGGLGRRLVIGAGAVVGMGAVVTKDVPAAVTVVGNPARPMVTR